MAVETARAKRLSAALIINEGRRERESQSNSGELYSPFL